MSSWVRTGDGGPLHLGVLWMTGRWATYTCCQSLGDGRMHWLPWDGQSKDAILQIWEWYLQPKKQWVYISWLEDPSSDGFEPQGLAARLAKALGDHVWRGLRKGTLPLCGDWGFWCGFCGNTPTHVCACVLWWGIIEGNDTRGCLQVGWRGVPYNW